jgi:hypothetical protein
LELPDGRAIPCDRHQGVAGGTVAERGGKHRSIIADRPLRRVTLLFAG